MGALSEPFTLATMDKRSKQAWLLARVREGLTAHVGKPTLVQRLLIDRAAMLTLRLAMLDQKIVDDEMLSLHGDQHAIAWQNALTRTLVAIGVHGEASKALPTTYRLDDYLASEAAE
jgi:hypothetical protein